MPDRGHKPTGKHPQKSKSEHEVKQSASRTSESSDLKSREYRDKDGNIHHHTHAYERDHPKH